MLRSCVGRLYTETSTELAVLQSNFALDCKHINRYADCSCGKQLAHDTLQHVQSAAVIHWATENYAVRLPQTMYKQLLYLMTVLSKALTQLERTMYLATLSCSV